jgi:hypothetical protein
MANPIIKIKRGVTAPSATLNAGEFAIDQAAKNLYLGIEQAGVVSNVIVGGEGTFATKTYVDSAVSAGTGSLGTMSTQNANAVAITGGAIDGTAIGATTPSTGKFTTIQDDGTGGINTFLNQTQFGWGISGGGGGPLYVGSTLDLSIGSGIIELGTSGYGAVRGLGAPVNDNDAARKKYVDDAVASLTSVFRYIGEIVWGVPNTPYDLDTMPSDQTTGAYYRVGNDATFTSGGNSYAAKAGDAFVKTTTGWQKIDNVDAEVLPTANEIAVTGDENVGYTVSIDPVFKTRVSDVETKTQNIDLAGTIAGVTRINDSVLVQGANAEFTLKSTSGTTDVISAKDGNITLGGAITGGQIAVRTEKFVVQEPTVGDQVWEINEYGAASNKLTAQSNKSSFNLDMDGNVTLGADVANTSVKAQGALIVSATGTRASQFTVESVYGPGAGNALFNVDGNTHDVVLGGNWPATEVKVRSTKLVGVDGTFGTPALENFIIDGGVY